MNIYKHSSIDRTPYTYLIGWSQYNKWYYGVQFAKNCHPTDLWIKYKTSSKFVKRFYEKFGEPDVVQTRKIFSDVDSARKYEHKVLRRLKVTNNDKWLNKTDNKSISLESGKQGAIKGAKVALLKRKIFYNNGEIEQLFYYNQNPDGWIKGKLVKSYKRSNTKGLNSTKGLKWYHNPNNNTEKTCCKDNEVPEGWVRGKGKSNRIKKFWYNNTIIEGQFEKDNFPENWIKGRLKTNTYYWVIHNRKP